MGKQRTGQCGPDSRVRGGKKKIKTEQISQYKSSLGPYFELCYVHWRQGDASGKDSSLSALFLVLTVSLLTVLSVYMASWLGSRGSGFKCWICFELTVWPGRHWLPSLTPVKQMGWMSSLTRLYLGANHLSACEKALSSLVKLRTDIDQISLRAFQATVFTFSAVPTSVGNLTEISQVQVHVLLSSLSFLWEPGLGSWSLSYYLQPPNFTLCCFGPPQPVRVTAPSNHLRKVFANPLPKNLTRFTSV